MNDFIKKNFQIPHIVGIVLGVLAGYAYYYFVGCRTGACPLKSNPYTMIVYGALIGYFLFDFLWIMVKKLKNNSEKKE